MIKYSRSFPTKTDGDIIVVRTKADVRVRIPCAMRGSDHNLELTLDEAVAIGESLVEAGRTKS